MTTPTDGLAGLPQPPAGPAVGGSRRFIGPAVMILVGFLAGSALAYVGRTMVNPLAVGAALVPGDDRISPAAVGVILTATPVGLLILTAASARRTPRVAAGIVAGLVMGSALGLSVIPTHSSDFHLEVALPLGQGGAEGAVPGRGVGLIFCVAGMLVLGLALKVYQRFGRAAGLGVLVVAVAVGLAAGGLFALILGVFVGIFAAPIAVAVETGNLRGRGSGAGAGRGWGVGGGRQATATPFGVAYGLVALLALVLFLFPALLVAARGGAEAVAAEKSRQVTARAERVLGPVDGALPVAIRSGFPPFGALVTPQHQCPSSAELSAAAARIGWSFTASPDAFPVVATSGLAVRVEPGDYGSCRYTVASRPQDLNAAGYAYDFRDSDT